MRRESLALAMIGTILAGGVAPAQQQQPFQRKPVVGLDYYYNHE